MVDRPKKPTALSSTPNVPQAQVSMTDSGSSLTAVLPTGESCKILLYGATLVSWKTSDGTERLWLSEAAKLDGSKAVRGGIPVVFPVFGPPPAKHATSSLPQHGFARTSNWEFLGKSTSESSSSSGSKQEDNAVKLDFGLSAESLDGASKKAWPHEFGLIYSVTLSSEGLETSMVVQNQGTEAWEFQVLLHTYLRVKDITKTTITGLQGASYFDKVLSSTKAEAATSLSITGETDRVYSPAGGALVVSEGGKPSYEVVRDNLENVVVWNPWKDKAVGMSDFMPKDGWRNMVCVEAGKVAGWVKLEGGDAWEGGVLVKVL